jgi:hypothetical protein
MMEWKSPGLNPGHLTRCKLTFIWNWSLNLCLVWSKEKSSWTAPPAPERISTKKELHKYYQKNAPPGWGGTNFCDLLNTSPNLNAIFRESSDHLWDYHGFLPNSFLHHESWNSYRKSEKSSFIHQISKTSMLSISTTISPMFINQIGSIFGKPSSNSLKIRLESVRRIELWTFLDTELVVNDPRKLNINHLCWKLGDFSNGKNLDILPIVEIGEISGDR